MVKSPKKEDNAPITTVDEIARRFLNTPPQPKVTKKKVKKKK